MGIFGEIKPHLKEYNPSKHILTEETFVYMDEEGVSWVDKSVELKDRV